MSKYKKVFVCGQYVEIPVQEPGYKMMEAVLRFPFIAVTDKYWTVRPEPDADPVCATIFDLETATFSSRTPWDGRLIAKDGKWINEAARELVRLIRDEL